MMNVSKTKVSFKDVCKELSISDATGKNWIKLGKIIPLEKTDKGALFFDKKSIADLKKSILNGRNKALKSRRNKKFVIGGTSFYKSYVSETSKNRSVVENILQSNVKFSYSFIEALIAECAIQQFLNCQKTNLLEKFLDNKLDLGVYNSLISDIISDAEAVRLVIKANPSIFQYKYIYEKNEDILGLLYISCKKLSNRKSSGAYYTPTKIVEKLVENIFNKETNLESKRLLDPSCGTGNFLLHLPPEICLENIFANDIDSMSIKITRINLALKYRPKDINVLYKNITESDFLTNYSETGFDYILGNPPWGCEFDDNYTAFLREKYSSVTGKNAESYDVFIEEALNKLKAGGKLSFVLPEAILNVQTHCPIRKLMKNTANIVYLSYLGNAFDKVQCPSIILELEKTKQKMDCIGMTVECGSKSYTIHEKRIVSEKCFNFLTTDNEQKIIEKITNIPNKLTLKNNADFALGIVTGDNTKYVSKNKTQRTEMVLRGSDIRRFNYENTNNFLEFKPESFQQVAPTEFYRAKEKLLYKFISKKLVFAYDNKQTLSLNSCNIVIPKFENLSIKYIMAILNSSVAQFFFKKQFNSMKVLRSHIEQIPIPNVEKEDHDAIVKMVDKILTAHDVYKEDELYKTLDKFIAKLFNLADEEYAIVSANNII